VRGYIGIPGKNKRDHVFYSIDKMMGHKKVQEITGILILQLVVDYRDPRPVSTLSCRSFGKSAKKSKPVAFSI